MGEVRGSVADNIGLIQTVRIGSLTEINYFATWARQGATDVTNGCVVHKVTGVPVAKDCMHWSHAHGCYHQRQQQQP